jgi:hypothetical protein
LVEVFFSLLIAPGPELYAPCLVSDYQPKSRDWAFLPAKLKLNFLGREGKMNSMHLEILKSAAER